MIHVKDTLNLGQSKTLNLTRDITLASGDVAYVGIGFKPRSLLVFVSLGDSTTIEGSFGFSDSLLGANAIYMDDGAQYAKGNGNVLQITTGGGVGQIAVVKSWDIDGFTLTWTKLGLPGAGTIYFQVLAFR